MRGLSFFALFIFSISSGYAEDCRDLLASELLSSVEAAQQRASLIFSPGSHPVRLSKLQNGPVHLTMSAVNHMVLMTFPQAGSEYFGIKPGGSTFGFSAPHIHHHQLIEGEGIFLRSLDYSETMPGLVLATLVVKSNGSNHVILKSARVTNQETGRIELLPHSGVVLGEVEDLKDNFVVSSRANENEFWIVDGTTTLRVAQFDSEGEVHLTRVIDIRSTLGQQLDELGIVGIQKIEFFGNGPLAYLKAKAEDGRIHLIPFSYSERLIENNKLAVDEAEELEKGDRRDADDEIEKIEQGEKAGQEEEFEETENGGSIETQRIVVRMHIWPEGSIVFEKAPKRLTAHPEQRVVVAGFSDRLEIYGLDIRSGSFSKIKTISADELANGVEIDGLAFYREIEFEYVEQGNSVYRKPKSVEIKGLLLLKNPETGEIMLDWRDLGGTR